MILTIAGQRHRAFGLCVVALAMAARAAHAQLPPTDDTFIQATTVTNNGAAGSLNLRQSNARRALLRFDLSSLPAGITGASLARASVRLFVNRVTTPGMFDVVRVTTPWAEGVVTGSTAPVFGASVTSAVTIASTATSDFVEFDVTEAVQDWLNGVSNNGLALVPNQTAIDVGFDSKETAHEPELQVFLNGPAGPQGPAGLPGSPGAQGAPGVPGAQGTTGPQGVPGTVGPTGPQGADGPEGPAGPGVSLPYTNGGSFTQPAFQISNASGAVAIRGNSPTGYGIHGTGAAGVIGEASSGTSGILGTGFAGVVATGTAASYGLVASGGMAPVRLVPSSTAGPPLSGSHSAGELYVDSSGALFYFNGSAWVTGTGTPGPQGPQGPSGPQGTAGADGATGADGSAGPQGTPGPAGPIGPAGPAGSVAAFNTGNGNTVPLNLGDCCEQQFTTLDTLSLLPGSYVINAVVLANAGTPGGGVQCKLRSPSALRYGHISSSGIVDSVTIPVTASVTLAASTNVSVVCWMFGSGSVFAQRVSLTAIQVQTLTTPSIVVQ